MATDGGTFTGIGKGPIEFKAEIIGLENLRRASKEVQKAVDKEIKKALYLAALRVEKEAKTSLAEGGKSGKIYTLRAAREGEEPTAWFTINGKSVGFVKRNKPHTASAPGEAPATDHGDLVRSIFADRAIGREGNEFVATVAAGRGGARYARMLEFGTRKMAARPFMFPALAKSKQYILERLAQAVNDGVAKSTQNTDGAGI